MSDVVLGPDVYVNASVALGSDPDKVVQRVLGRTDRKAKTTKWVLERVYAMLSQVPEFKADAVEAQVKLIRSLVEIVDDKTPHGAEAWEEALVAAAKNCAAKRVITDHPDLLEKGSASGVDFVSTEEWLLEQALPPPPPPGVKAK